MNINIKSIQDNGDLDNERVILKCLSDDDIGHYVLFDTTYNQEGSITNKMRHPYWFPDKKIKKGELVVLYTKIGVNKTVLKKSGITVHFMYRDLEKTIWNKDGDCAVLMDIREWDYVIVDENKDI